MPNVKKLIEKMKLQPNGIRPEEAEKVLAAYGYIPARQKGSHRQYLNQIPRCKQRGIKLATLQSSGVFDPRGIRQLAVQARPLGSLLAGIKEPGT